jgi:CelD/BcsL family acetyltransferase involved in cellulose biosynthesis
MKTILYTLIDQDFIKSWQSLWNKASYATYTNSPQWFLSVIETFGYKEFAIVALYKKEELVGVVGLIKQKKYGIMCYSVVPQDFVCANPFLVDPEDSKSVKALIRHLEAMGTICLSNIRDEFVAGLKHYSKDVDASPITVNYFMEIQKDEKGDVLIRHKKRILRRSEVIENDLFLQTYSGVDTEALETAFAIDNKSRKQEKGYNAFAQDITKAFYRSLAKHFQEKFVTYILYHKKKAISFQIGFIVNNIFYASQISSLKEYEQYSIGRSLLAKVIEKLGIEGITILDFGSGDDHVKKSFTKQYHTFNDVIITKSSFERQYIKNVGLSKKSLYNVLYRNATVYATYRRIKKVVPFISHA